MVGNRSLSDLRRALTPRGTGVLVGGEGGGRWIGAVGRSLRALVLSPFVSQRLRMIIPTANTADLQFLKELIEAGKVTPVVDRTYSLSDVPDAVRYLDEGRARGKIVINVRDAERRSARGTITSHAAAPAYATGGIRR
jgi:NADPH:quinone reductase-like Zn-dependent oxidoreductase